MQDLATLGNIQRQAKHRLVMPETNCPYDSAQAVLSVAAIYLSKFAIFSDVNSNQLVSVPEEMQELSHLGKLKYNKRKVIFAIYSLHTCRKKTALKTLFDVTESRTHFSLSTSGYPDKKLIC